MLLWPVFKNIMTSNIQLKSQNYFAASILWSTSSREELWATWKVPKSVFLFFFIFSACENKWPDIYLSSVYSSMWPAFSRPELELINAFIQNVFYFLKWYFNIVSISHLRFRYYIQSQIFTVDLGQNWQISNRLSYNQGNIINSSAEWNSLAYPFFRHQELPFCILLLDVVVLHFHLMGELQPLLERLWWWPATPWLQLFFGFLQCHAHLCQIFVTS